MLNIIAKLFAISMFQLLALALSSARTVHPANANKLDITILYESLCPDSVRFMATQLEPTYANLGQHLDIKLVPFGKSHSDENGSKFYCQHGPDECAGNRMQSCVLHQQGTQDQRVRFAVCQMKSNDRLTIDRCAESVGLRSDISDCMDTAVGTHLQLQAEQLTNIYAPSFVPTIIYDGVFDQQLQDASLTNFRGIVCRLLIKRNVISEACQ